ncbi:MAG: hypothetical protein IKT73_02360, partial [Anaerotignum sp.]|nr:hypothetical protein [Anaerotignum sp.]
TNGKFYEMTGYMKHVSADDMALMAFLTLSDPSLDYYQTAHIADYNTLTSVMKHHLKQNLLKAMHLCRHLQHSLTKLQASLLK